MNEDETMSSFHKELHPKPKHQLLKKFEYPHLVVIKNSSRSIQVRNNHDAQKLLVLHRFFHRIPLLLRLN